MVMLSLWYLSYDRQARHCRASDRHSDRGGLTDNSSHFESMFLMDAHVNPRGLIAARPGMTSQNAMPLNIRIFVTIAERPQY
ncbi:MAG: hypothetical protein ACJ8F2_25480 [Xanthobacteraceae bacterium]